MGSFLFIFFLLVFLSLLVSVFALKTYRELETAKRKLHRYGHLVSQEEYQNTLTSDIESKKRHKLQLADEETRLRTSVENLSQKLAELKEEDFLESFGFYQPKYDFITSGSYESLLKKNGDSQKEMMKNKTAAICKTPWSIGGSEKEGKKMVNSFLQLVLTIFNSKCDDLILKLKYSSNVDTVEPRIKKHFDRLNKTSKVIHCEITEPYLKLKTKQLHLQYQIEVEKYEDSEREKEMRKEAKDRQKTEKLMRQAEEAEERENLFQQDLENALKEQELSYGVEREKLEIQVQQLRQKVEEAKNEKDKANEEAAQTKSGNIYVVSNFGSLGRNIYRIWMTKSGTPDQTINTMSTAVPFPFDVHLKFFSEEATDTMNRLKLAFSNRSVNKINERRCFYNASLDEILQAVKEIKEDTGVIKSIRVVEKAPSAYEYRRTQAIERNNNPASHPDGTNTSSNETA